MGSERVVVLKVEFDVASLAMVRLIVIEGAIQPQGSRCSLETRAYLPQLESKDHTVDIKVLRSTQARFGLEEADTTTYWKEKLLTQVSTAPYVLSASFYPTTLSKVSVLFIQKVDRIQVTTGFVAPYLSEKERVKWGAIPCSQVRYVIQDEASVLLTIKGLDAVIYGDILACLQSFLSDATTSTLSLTFLEPTGMYVTRTWIKV